MQWHFFTRFKRWLIPSLHLVLFVAGLQFIEVLALIYRIKMELGESRSFLGVCVNLFVVLYVLRLMRGLLY